MELRTSSEISLQLQQDFLCFAKRRIFKVWVMVECFLSRQLVAAKGVFLDIEDLKDCLRLICQNTSLQNKAK